MSVVYWIHLPEHTDMFSQGYVGVCCKDAQHRFKAHKKAAEANSSNVVHRAIRKYKDLIVIDTLLEGSSEYCYDIENKLRSSINIGWNMAVGGRVPHGMPHTQEVKDKISNIRKNFSPEKKARLALTNGMRGKKHTPEAREKVIKSLNRNGCKGWLPWKHPMANKEMWKMADEVFDFLLEFPNSTHYKIAKALPIAKKTALTIKEKIESGWNPREDLEWITFHEAKE